MTEILKCDGCDKEITTNRQLSISGTYTLSWQGAMSASYDKHFHNKDCIQQWLNEKVGKTE